MKQINGGWARVGRIAAETGLGRRTLRRLAREGRVRVAKLGPQATQTFYCREDVFAVLGWTPGDNTKPAPTEPQ
jgi:hypothetical protein